jgi:hypothetical protein
MYTFYRKEKPKKQDDVARKKEVNQEEAASGSSITDSINSGSGPD